MNTMQKSLLALLAVIVVTLPLGIVADQSDDSEPGTNGFLQGGVEDDSSLAGEDVSSKADGSNELDDGTTEMIPASSREPVDVELKQDSTNGESGPSPEQPSTPTNAIEEQNTQDKEKVWSDISSAITGLNDMVGDDMFRELTRKDQTTMEVRVDLDFWQRVRYETRVDLKNDISNIWHLYVRQYNEDDQSAVFFVDDVTGKTIDIFTQRGGPEQ